MKNLPEAIAVSIATFLCVLAVGFSEDALFRSHVSVIASVLFVSSIILFRRVEFVDAGATRIEVDKSGYMDGVVKYGVIATIFWGIVGFLVGVIAASQLAWPELNLEPWLNFGRVRPLHTSAVVFAFGGNALIATSFYVVQRTSRAQLWGGNLAWFVFWGYQLFILMAASGYLLGVTQ
jgi:cytochrome c oxidase cbb3-type subunit 1